ncbi:MAG: hypothetical protein HW412_1317 [Bacteroidetes bacterium]|nr:hypothetical protein [Bacteroidota bacterium]
MAKKALSWSLVWMLSAAHAGNVSDTVIIASVGRFTITARDLLDSYEFGPAFVKRSANPLRSHLSYMVYERVLALEAERLRYDTTEFVHDRVVALDEDLTVDELYKDRILARVHLTPAEIDTGIQKAKMNLRLRWIYAKTLADAQRINGQIKQGVSYDVLFARQGDRSDTLDKRFLETTLLKLESDNPDLAAKISHLHAREISAPIEGPDGFYIFRIDQIWQNPLTTETEYTALKDQAIKALTSARADALAGGFVKEKMKSVNPIIKADGFNIVRAYIAERGLSRDTRVKWDIPSTFMTEAGPLPISSSGKFLSRPLVTFGSQTLTVRDYLRWFDIRQFQLKTSSLTAFNSSVKKTIWKMVQDKLLSQEAYSLGLNRRSVLQLEKRKWEAKLLYLAGRSHVARTVALSNSAVKNEYTIHRQRYREASGKTMSFDQAKEQIKLDLYYSEESKALLRALQRLQREFPVAINEEAVRSLSATVVKETSPIDVIFYKPGGTFPRVAFPSIDERWQSFPSTLR